MIAEDVRMFQRQQPPLLKYLYVSLSNVCNARCSYCDVHEAIPQRGSHTPDAVSQLLAEARGLGCVLVHFMGGGEPLIARDFLPAVEACSTLRMAVSITTNGSHLGRRIAAMPNETDLRSVLVSVDSHISSRHDSIRGVPGLWRRATEGIEACLGRFPKARVILNHVLSKDNVEHLEAYVAWAGAIGASAVNLIPVKDQPGLSATPEQASIFARQQDGLRAAARRRGVDLLYDAQDAQTWAEVRAGMCDEPEYRCLFPEHALYVDLPTGAVFPCDCTVHRAPNERFELGNVWGAGLAAAWSGDAAASIREILASPCDPGCKHDCDWNNRRTNRALHAQAEHCAE